MKLQLVSYGRLSKLIGPKLRPRLGEGRYNAAPVHVYMKYRPISNSQLLWVENVRNFYLEPYQFCRI